MMIMAEENPEKTLEKITKILEEAPVSPPLRRFLQIASRVKDPSMILSTSKDRVAQKF